MRYWFWSDLHIGHRWLAETHRPHYGGTVDTHNTAIVNTINAKVHPADTLVIVGDAIMGTFADGVETLSALPCQVVLIGGNHDRFHPDYHSNPVKQEKGRTMYGDRIRIHPDLVVDGAEFNIPGAILCHFPWQGTPDRHDGRGLIEKYGPDRYKHPRKLLVHGHLHTTDRFGPGRVEVSADAFPDGPVSEDEIRDWIADHPIR